MNEICNAITLGISSKGFSENKQCFPMISLGGFLNGHHVAMKWPHFIYLLI